MAEGAGTAPGSSDTAPDDLILPFVIESSGIRGRLLRLGAPIDTILRRPDYPDPVATLLGELAALGTILASTLKYDGVFTIQAQGSDPIRTMVADVTSGGDIRGYAGYDAEAVKALEAEAPLPPFETGPWLGGGHLAFTVDQGEDTQRYQGIVELAGPRLADCLLHYFRQSQQVNAGILVATARDPESGAWRAGSLLIERIPKSAQELADSVSEEDWRRALILMASCTEAELLDPKLPGEHLLYRLFHEDGVRVFETRDLRVGCRCTRERVANILRSFPRGEVEDLKVDGEVVMNCEFCNHAFRFDSLELDRIYEMGSGSGSDSETAP